MKTRQSFVANSSSSSFIVAIDPSIGFGFSGHIRITNEEDLMAHIKSRAEETTYIDHGVIENDTEFFIYAGWNVYSQYKECKKHLDQGKHIIMTRYDRDDQISHDVHSFYIQNNCVIIDEDWDA